MTTAAVVQRYDRWNDVVEPPCLWLLAAQCNSVCELPELLALHPLLWRCRALVSWKKRFFAQSRHNLEGHAKAIGVEAAFEPALAHRLRVVLLQRLDYPISAEKRQSGCVLLL